MASILTSPPRWRAARSLRTLAAALQLQAIRAGAGLGILPCFAGDADPALVRLTAPVAEPAADQWLIVHPDLKGAARVRLMMEWLRATFREGRPALEGLRPPRRAR